MHIQVEVFSDREFQNLLENEINKKFPDVDLKIIVRESQQVLQLTQIIVGIAGMVLEIINLILTLKDKENKKIKVKIKVENEKSKEMELGIANQDVDVNKIVEDFLNS